MDCLSTCPLQFCVSFFLLFLFCMYSFVKQNRDALSRRSSINSIQSPWVITLCYNILLLLLSSPLLSSPLLSSPLLSSLLVLLCSCARLVSFLVIILLSILLSFLFTSPLFFSPFLSCFFSPFSLVLFSSSLLVDLTCLLSTPLFSACFFFPSCSLPSFLLLFPLLFPLSAPFLFLLPLFSCPPFIIPTCGPLLSSPLLSWFSFFSPCFLSGPLSSPFLSHFLSSFLWTSIKTKLQFLMSSLLVKWNVFMVLKEQTKHVITKCLAEQKNAIRCK